MRKLFFLALLAATTAAIAADQATSRFTPSDLDRARGMLRIARDEVLQYFYDPTKLAVANFSQRCAEADKALAQARSNDEALLIIAQPFLDIGDSHTRFLPPSRQGRVEHHWRFHAVGDAVYVSEVDRGSDAEKKGLRVGDKLLAIDGIAPARANRWTMQYLLYSLAPRTGMRVVAQSPGQPPRQMDIAGEFKAGTKLRDLRNDRDYYELVLDSEHRDTRLKSRLVDLPGDVLVWKLQEFDEDKITAGLRKTGSAKAVVLDLRGNPGGVIYSVEDMLDGLFTDNFEAYTRKERDKTEKFRVKGKGRFKGLLLVLIDNSSASASEIFARTVQMKQRGILLGDRTAGAVSAAQVHSLTLGNAESFVRFGVGVTISDVTMGDGTTIEGKGVGPDYQIIPTHEQLFAGHDPVLAKALSIAGYKLSAEDAGKLFPPLH